MNNDDCYDYRKKIGLPVTKKLIYKDMENKCHFVSSYSIIKEYNLSDYWAILELNFKDGIQPVRIHSMYFLQMQNPNFKRELSFVDGHPTISQSENSEASIVRNISTLNDTSNISKHDEKSSKNTRIKKQYHNSDFEIER